jgi:hypothetical protein
VNRTASSISARILFNAIFEIRAICCTHNLSSSSRERAREISVTPDERTETSRWGYPVNKIGCRPSSSGYFKLFGHSMLKSHLAIDFSSILRRSTSTRIVALFRILLARQICKTDQPGPLINSAISNYPPSRMRSFTRRNLFSRIIRD